MSNIAFPSTLGSQTFTDKEVQLLSQDFEAVITDASQWSILDLKQVCTRLTEGLSEVYGKNLLSDEAFDLEKVKVLSKRNGLIHIKSTKELAAKLEVKTSEGSREFFEEWLLACLDDVKVASMGRRFADREVRPAEDPRKQAWAHLIVLSAFETAKDTSTA